MTAHDAPRKSAAYQVRDEELLLDVYKKLFWNRLIPHVPASITPNTLTVIGQLCALTSPLMTYMAVFGGFALGYVMSALLLLAYLTLDNIDGAHARRTGQASVLGEFLDHGLDGLASGAILIVSGMVLSLQGTWLVLICGLAGFGFAALFWEQFRTGLLVIPAVSSAEGVTLLMIYQLVAYIAGAPEWLAFSTDSFTVGTALIGALIIGYACAALPSIFRAAKKGVSALELLPLLALVGAQIALPHTGAMAFIPAATVGLLAADFTCRLIVLRHRGQEGPVLAPHLYLTALPVLGAYLAPEFLSPSLWAALALAMMVASYGTHLVRGGRELLSKKVA